VSGGANLGVIAAQLAHVALVPVVGLQARYERTVFRLPLQRTGIAHTFGSATGGLGLVFSDRVSVVPVVTVPFGSSESKPAFSIGLTYNVGQR
jgi:hypothetical protein